MKNRAARKKYKGAGNVSKKKVVDKRDSKVQMNGNSEDSLDIAEETRDGFEKKCESSPGSTHNIDTDLDTSLDRTGDSSCSADLANQSVHRADLYGTDKDPSYEEDDMISNERESSFKYESVKKIENTFPESDLNNNSPRYLHETQGKHLLPDNKQGKHNQVSLPTSFGGLFNNCSQQVAPPNAPCDVEVFRQSYQEPEVSPHKSRNCNNSMPAQNQYYNSSQQHSLHGSTEQGYFHGQSFVHGASEQQHYHDNGDQTQLHSTYEQFHGTHGQQQFGQQQFKCTPNQQFHNKPNQHHFPAMPAQGMHDSQTRQHFEHPDIKSNTLPYQIETNPNYLSPTGYRRGLADDQNIAAEQLASELVKTYGGQNSHMITDILKVNGGQEDSCDFDYGGFERATPGTPRRNISTPQMINDVLNTPQPMRHLADDYGERDSSRLTAPRQASTPDTYKSVHKADPGFHGSITYNDVHLHGGKWSTSHVYEGVESQFPDDKQVLRRSTSQIHGVDNGVPGIGQSGFTSQAYTSHVTMPNNQQIQDHYHARSCAVLSSPTLMSGGHDQGEITKTTFTSREHMEMHLSDKLKYKCGRHSVAHPLSHAEYSSIYPSRDFIERTTRPMSEPQSEFSKRNVVQQPKRQQESSQRYNPNQDSCRPIKKRRVSKYNTDDIRVPPQMPIFDDMMHKYAPSSREETHQSRHKYFVVNPSDLTSMPPKTLITKYIDFLIGENEQITEISKSINPPVDIYVTEDMYFMDSLKVQVPFPSKKFVEWVSSFYPKLNFLEMKFKGRYPEIPTKGTLLKADPRPTQQILEDTFYYFQRELMNAQG